MANKPLNARGVWLALAASGLLLLATSVGVRAQTIDRVVADVDGQPITTYDMKAFSAANGLTAPGPGNPAANAETKQVLKGLMEQKLLEVESKKYAGKVDDGQIDSYIQSIEAQNHITEQQFRGQLAANGLTYDEFRQHAREQLERMTMLQ
ncbi:MAG: SurA N-terminal domain-containing protein, partial [Candidatus Binataceae bacterium]